MSMSSLESLSTSARQEPQGEETADFNSGLLDGEHESMLGGVASDDELKKTSSSSCDEASYYQISPSSVDTWTPTSTPVTATSVASNHSLISSVPSTTSSPKLTPQNSTERRQVSVYAANSLIRQLLQTSPQYSHLLRDIAMHASPNGSTAQSPIMTTASGSGSPKQMREMRSDGRSQPLTASSSSSIEQQQRSSSPAHQQQQQGDGGSPTLSSSVHSRIASRRLVNGYVNVENENRVETGTGRNRPRPSTAPTERPEAQQPTVSGPLEQTDRHRSFEVLDRDVASHAANGKQAGGASIHVSNQQLHKQQQQQQGGVCQYQQQQQQRSSPQQQQNRSSPPQQRSSPQQSEQAVTAETSSCLLQARNINSPSHSPSGSQQNVCAHVAIATRATQMVERLSEENRALRQELKVYYKKVSKLEKVERDIQKVNDAYEMLARHSQKRENLEKLMRLKLDAEITRLTETNQQIQDHLEQTLIQLQRRQGYSASDSELKKEVQRKDALIAKFIAQNRELTTAKLRLESDINKQCSVVQETRARIKMLENVLAKEVLEKRRGRLDRQHSASSEQQGAGENSEGKPDEDFPPFRYQQCDTDDGISSDSESATNIHGLIRQMQEKERHILRLEAEVARWEQKFLEETVFRQLAVDAISIPKDAKIAALVQNSADTDKLLTEARLEKLAYLKELHNANERCAHLEAKVKSLHADLAEKDGLIRVLQHHSSLSRANSISSLLATSCSSPVHSPPQQHRSPSGTVGHSSKTTSGSSSRQNSQLSAGSLSLTKNNKLAGNFGVHDVRQMPQLDVMSYNGCEETDQLKQCFWQV